MRVAVIGGTGFVGTAVARRLLERGIEPVAVARGQHPVDLPPGTIIEFGDRMDEARMAEILRVHKIDTVIDIFCLGLLNTRSVLEAVARRGGRYVMLSAVDVYANYGGLLRREEPVPLLRPAREDDALRSFRYPYRGNPRRPQGVDDVMLDDYDKIPIEVAALADRRFDATIIRSASIFGPGDKQHRFGWMVAALTKGGTTWLDERAAYWGNSYGYIDDVAEAMVLAALSDDAARQIYNVGQSVVRTPVQWLERLAAVMGLKATVELVPPGAKGLQWERAEASDLRYPLTLDTSRIREELGFAEIVPEDEALAETIAYEFV